MNKIQILDCTLRDGGYCNKWNFGYENIRKIISGLDNAGTEIIECGFLTNKVVSSQDETRFNCVGDVAKVLPEKREGRKYVAMINYGEYAVEDLPVNDGSSIDGIRIAFHKKDRYEAMDLCKKIRDKGYLVFVQDMVSHHYSDEEYIELIHCVNDIEPYAFYLVDSFGVMKDKELIRLFYLIEHNLKRTIWIGFHSHNNMQLAYANAQRLVNERTNCNLIIDTSIFGMGRGAGNLNTEIFIEYLNENIGKHYKIRPLLTVIDDVLSKCYQKNYWGYSLPNYISAMHDAHSDYAIYLDDKKTLTVEDMNCIFDLMEDDRKESFDKEYIETLYLQYQESNSVHEDHLSDLRKIISGEDVIVIAPGPSSAKERKKIIEYIQSNKAVVISINYEFDPKYVDYIFLSNLRRYREMEKTKHEKCIVTSNIPADHAYIQINYVDLLNAEEGVVDNAGLMLIKLLIILEAKKVMIAGMDGYSLDLMDDYAVEKMNFHTKIDLAEDRNIKMTNVIKEYRKLIDIQFITEPRHLFVS